MIFLSVEELKEKSIVSNQGNEIIFNNKIFRKGPDFSLRNWEKARQLSEEYFKSNRLCLIVNNESYISLWVEKERTLETYVNNRLSDKKNQKVIACLDSQAVQIQVKLILEKLNYRVVIIKEKENLINKLKIENPRLIFIDFNICDLNEPQLYKILHKIDYFKNVPIVKLINKENLVDKIRNKLANSPYSLLKPFQPNDLISVVEKFVNN